MWENYLILERLKNTLNQHFNLNVFSGAPLRLRARKLIIWRKLPMR